MKSVTCIISSVGWAGEGPDESEVLRCAQKILNTEPNYVN